ncbi:uncharacterized protein N7482_010323 [Penicillium canariense]|uniref:RNA polymerase II transcription factor SIII, subunit A n=1 Tax=Penicillium canariense TaxID=189055 RepID=A0A9W9LCU3_9EURO|nr:uncharacterized protein N7482_010323 [Penicillium canariense]KAJ5151071.1 hypothetical protein N7482_010323 [Penicillium canariense]
MPVPTLKHLATATAVKHVKLLNDIGNLPYALVRPILMKVDNPEKLHSMEVLSPQLAEEDQEIWLELIKRDIPQWNTYDLPKHTNRWYEIYCDLRAEVQRELDADAEKMKMAIDGIKSERARLEPEVMKHLPAMKPSLRQRIASFDRRSGGRGSSLSRGDTLAPGAKKKSTIFTPQRRNNALAVPTKHLSNRATQIKQAPRSLVEVHRRPAEQPVARHDNPIASGRSPGKSASASAHPASESRGSSSLAEREARLKAIASGRPLPLKPLPSSAAATVNTHTAPSPAKEASSPAHRSILKRKASSPPPQISSQFSPMPANTDGQASGQSNNNGPVLGLPARPAVVRKRADVDIFLRPKKKRPL